MRRLGLAVMLAVLAGVAWWLIGFLPWVTAGFTWPSNAGAPLGSAGVGLEGVRLPLPLIAPFLPVLVACALIGGVVAGLTPVGFTHLPRWLGVVVVWIAVGGTLLATTYVSLTVVRAQTGADFASDKRVLAGLALAGLIATLVGLLSGTISVLRHGFTAIAGAFAAGAVPVWLNAFLFGEPHSTQTYHSYATFTQAMLGLVLLAGLIVSVHRTTWSALWWPFAAAIVWCAGPAVVALTYFAAQLRPASGLSSGLSAQLDATRQVFVHTLLHTHPPIWPIAGAFAIALVWLIRQGVHREPYDARAHRMPESDTSHHPDHYPSGESGSTAERPVT
jgi:hypothetical protein